MILSKIKAFCASVENSPNLYSKYNHYLTQEEETDAETTGEEAPSPEKEQAKEEAEAGEGEKGDNKDEAKASDKKAEEETVRFVAYASFVIPSRVKGTH